MLARADVVVRKHRHLVIIGLGMRTMPRRLRIARRTLRRNRPFRPPQRRERCLAGRGAAGRERNRGPETPEPLRPARTPMRPARMLRQARRRGESVEWIISWKIADLRTSCPTGKEGAICGRADADHRCIAHGQESQRAVKPKGRNGMDHSVDRLRSPPRPGSAAQAWRRSGQKGRPQRPCLRPAGEQDESGDSTAAATAERTRNAPRTATGQCA